MIRSLKLASGIAAAAVASLAIPAHAQTTLTYSSWVPPTHHLTIWQANWAADVEKATELISAVAPAPGSSAISGRMWRAGV